MIEMNNWHPFARYGVAAAAVRFKKQRKDLKNRPLLWSLAKEALEDLLSQIILEPVPGKATDEIAYQLLSESRLKSRKNAANGYFTAPHVLTSNNVADILKETRNLIKVLSGKDEGKRYELKRSFSPLIAKFNAGKKSMSNPKLDTLIAAYTCIGALTALKPAAFIKDINDNFSNAGIIPDLPLFDGDETPLIDFVDLFKEIISHGVKNGYSAKSTKEKKYNRPAVFYGNYPDAPRSFGLGMVSLVAAIGKWAKEHETLYDQSRKVLEQLQKNPIYIISYIGSRQERYHHHMVELALTGQLYRILESVRKVSLLGVEDGTKYSDPKWKLFIQAVDQFIRFFNPSSWRNFLAYRATYPTEFSKLIESYFMKNKTYSDELVNSALSFGQCLNRAAYRAAAQRVDDNAKKKVEKMTEEEKKARKRLIQKENHQILLQLESIVESAANNRDLISRLHQQVGRLTMQNIDQEASFFLKEVMKGEEIVSNNDAQDFILAFMRLSTYNSKSVAIDASNEGNYANTNDLP